MADAPDLGSGPERIGGSSPLARTSFVKLADGCAARIFRRSRQFQFRFHPRHFIVEFQDWLDGRMHFVVADFFDKLARGPAGGEGLILRVPFLEMFLGAGVQKRPAFGLAADAAAPRLGRQPRAVTFLRLAKLAVKRVGAQRVKHAVLRGGFGIEQRVRGQQPQPGARAVNPPAPVRIVSRPVFNLRNRAFLRHDRRGVRFAEKSFEQTRRLRLRQIHVHEHHAGGVEHQATVGIARDDGGGFTGIVFDFAQHRLAKRAVGIITAVLRRKIAARKPLGELLRGLVGERLCLGNVIG